MIEEVSEHQDGEIQSWQLSGRDEIDRAGQLSAISGTSTVYERSGGCK